MHADVGLKSKRNGEYLGNSTFSMDSMDIEGEMGKRADKETKLFDNNNKIRCLYCSALLQNLVVYRKSKILPDYGWSKDETGITAVFLATLATNNQVY